ncbi:hypothetical protein PCASD_18936 [Puccinia coronata f. sp. avenae]|uniref:Uncharacterized protein n=1 Tax=Puccinia coronata f. sp. avenae TaxID=200324 RepID=A0A2N5T202_9BASI|nr:hypothetical protein PCASD_18936 [Puccinia coronata f. sp. avenae]
MGVGCTTEEMVSPPSPFPYPPLSPTKPNHPLAMFTSYSPQSFIRTSTFQGIPLPMTGPASEIGTAPSDVFITPSAPQTEKKVTKAKKAEVKWVAYKHQKDSAVSFNPEGIDWTNFQKIVRTKSWKSFSTMPSMIEERSKSDPPSITWRAFILQNEEYVKGTLVVIFSDYDFQKWMDCIVENNAKRGGIILTMENLLVKKKLAHMEALLAKSICAESSRLASQSGPAASDDENSSCQDYEDLDVYLNDIYKTYGINAEFDCKIPCYPHPTDKQKYILLTPDNVELWAKELMRKTPGISIDSPPSHFKYKTRKTPALASNSPSSGAGSLNTLQLMAIATAVAQAQAVVNSSNLREKAPAEARANSPTSSTTNICNFTQRKNNCLG